jgi:hypothetical protein
MHEFKENSRMVQLRLINGGKLKEQPASFNVRLFSAYSIVDNYCGRDRVRFNWIYLDRQCSVAPYEGLINGYKNIDERIRPCFEAHIDELFTEDEVEALESFLTESLGTNLHKTEEALPSSSLFVPMPYRDVPTGIGRGFYHFPDVDCSMLPFKVCAYFDLRNCPPSIALQRDARENGMDFLKEALDALGLAGKVTPQEHDEALDLIYDRWGLFVQRGKTREEREKERTTMLEAGNNSPPQSD